MLQLILLCLVLVVGMGLSLEAGLLGPLGHDVGHMSATLSIFLVGSLLLSLALLFSPNRDLPRLFSQPRWLLTGGILGPVYVVALTLATPLVGVGMTMVGILCGQVAASMAVDHFGLFGTMRRRIDGYRVAVLLLIAAALWLIN